MTEEEVFKVSFDAKKSKTLCPIGDIHKYNKWHDKELYHDVLQWLYKTDVAVVGMGDYIECSIRDSIGLFDQEEFLDVQLDSIIEDFQPLADENKLLGLLNGNHENRVKVKTGMDLTALICKQLGVEYFGEGAVLSINVGEETYTFYGTHGYSRASTRTGKMNACLRLSKVVDAECYIMGHVHSLDHFKEDIYRIGNGRLIKTPRHYVITGSFLKYWGSYAQRRGWSPSGATGSPKIKMHADVHRISISL